MPFAPSVLADKGAIYYEGAEKVEYPAQFMTITMNVKEAGQKAVAVRHVDNTARPHFVTREANPSLYAIIENFESITGFPIVINTSFNKHEEPIVATLEEAIARLIDESVEYLSVGSGWLLSKYSSPIAFQKSWRELGVVD